MALGKGKKSRQRPTRSLRVEGLETRDLMAGDVTAEVVKGSLIVRGDDNNNDIIITEPTPGSFQIASGNTSVTTVNGAAGPLTFDNVTKDVKIYLNDGDDRLSITGNIARDLVIDGEDGAQNITVNTVAGTQMAIGRRLNIINDVGADTIAINNVRTNENLKISTGDGGSTITISTADVRKHFDLRTRDGADTIRINDITVRGKTSVATGGANDIVEVEVGADASGPRSFFMGAVTVSMGQGNDRLTVGKAGDSGRGADFKGPVFAHGNKNDGGTLPGNANPNDATLTTTDGDVLDAAVNNGNTFTKRPKFKGFGRIIP